MTTEASSLETVIAFLDRAVTGDGRAGVRLALDLLERGVPGDEIVVDLLAPVQHEVGERWLRNDWNVAEEHLASGVTQKALDALANSVEPPAPHGLLVVACAEGDWHSLPAQMFAELLRMHGYAVAFLGASTPVDQVAKLVARHRPDALVVSCNLPLFFGGVTRMVDAAHLEGVPVIAGGRALGHSPQRARRLGADAWGATIAEATTILDGWQNAPPQPSPEPTPLDMAALQLDADASSIADGGYAALLGAYPRMAAYDEHQLARTREDLAFITRFVAAARLVDDPSVLTEFLDWLGALLAGRDVPRAALDAGLAVLAPLIGAVDSKAGELTLAALPQ